MKGFYNTSGSTRTDIVDCGDIDNGAEFVSNTFGTDNLRDCGGTTPTGGTNTEPIDTSCDGGVYCNNSNAINHNELYDVIVEGANTCANSSVCQFYDEIEDEIQDVDPIYDEVLEVYAETGEWVTLDEATSILDDLDNPLDEEDIPEAEDFLPNETISGCMDAEANNYNPLANIGSADLCIFDEIDTDLKKDVINNNIYFFFRMELKFAFS